MARDFVGEAEVGVVVDIGQISQSDRRVLEKAVRSGRLVKWRGYWHPVTGADWGIGPLKTCYGTPSLKARVSQ